MSRLNEFEKSLLTINKKYETKCKDEHCKEAIDVMKKKIVGLKNKILTISKAKHDMENRLNIENLHLKQKLKPKTPASVTISTQTNVSGTIFPKDQIDSLLISFDDDDDEEVNALHDVSNSNVVTSNLEDSSSSNALDGDYGYDSDDTTRLVIDLGRSEAELETDACQNFQSFGHNQQNNISNEAVSDVLVDDMAPVEQKKKYVCRARMSRIGTHACNFCDARFKRPCRLRQHMESNHSEDMHPCKACRKLFGRSAFLFKFHFI